uniref:Protein-cysteine N-palmitoyltransferase Rasp n=1 Tax=Heliothis virescens TaxID=7102 RepID=A0A2A4JTP1_HELVI
MKNEVNIIENSIHFSLWILACFYSLFKLYHAQTEIIDSNPELRYELGDLNPGWRLISRQKDESDVEWSTWKYLIQTSWFYLLLQFFVSEIIRRTNAALVKYWYSLSSIIFIVKYMGVRQLIIILAQPVIFSAIIFSGGKKISIWLTSILLLAGYNSLKYKYFFWHFLDTENLEDEEVFVMLYAIAWVELRCISFCLDYVDKKEKYLQAKDKSKEVGTTRSEDLINMFSYVLYLPLLFVGPIILYEEFEKSFHVSNKGLHTRLKSFTLDMIRFLIYSILLEVAFHYVYFFAMQSQIEAIRKLPSLALCGGGLWMGLEFHMKYVISYGTTAAYSRLDNIDPPPTPRCIFRIHVYSQMWRYFDVGLYRFLLKYIYKPVYLTLSNSFKISKIIYKLISSLITFTFIFMWHGTMWNIFVWSVLNYVGIVIEYFGKAVAGTEKYKLFKANVLQTNAMEVRFIAFLCAPLLGLSAISNFYLFAGSEIGDVYFDLLKWPSLYNCFIVYTSLYCCCHVAIALYDVPSRTDVKKKESKTVF